jgi:hypothetical protein
MSFLQKSDLKKHLAARATNLSHHSESPSMEHARVILRDGNLITLPDPVKEETITTTVVRLT